MRRELFTLALVAVLAGGGKAEAEDGEFAVPPYIDGDLAYHHHPVLRFVLYDPDAAPDPFPRLVGLITPRADIGIDRSGERTRYREIHTHEAISGRLHTESVDPLKKYRLGDFIALWETVNANVTDLVARTEREGTVYLFDYNRFRGTYYATRIEPPSKLPEVTLDDGRHIVVFLPERQEPEADAPQPAASASSPDP